MIRPSSYSQPVILGLVLAAAAASSSSAANVLWSIGAKDTNTAEFALAPGDYHAYRQPGVFIVGQSDAKDGLALCAARAGRLPAGRPAHRRPSRSSSPSKRRRPRSAAWSWTLLTRTRAARQSCASRSMTSRDPVPGAQGRRRRLGLRGEPAKGRPWVVTLDLAADTLKAGENRIAITTLTGSWVLWDAVRFEAPAGTKLTSLQDRTLVTGVTATRGVLALHDGKPAHVINLNICQVGRPAEATVRVGKQDPVKHPAPRGLADRRGFRPAGDGQRNRPGERERRVTGNRAEGRGA